MPETHIPKAFEKFEIQAYRRKPKDLKLLRQTHVAFSGSPQKHPYDPHRVVLISDPYSTSTVYYEFLKSDISYIEELPNVVNVDGETVMMVRVWVKKKSIAVRSSAFIVADTSRS